MSWPQANLDPVRQLRVMAAVLPGVGLVEEVIPAPFEAVWPQMERLEETVPTFDAMVAALEILSRHGEHLVIRAKSPFVPLWTRFEVELRPGWCWMQSKVYLVGFAARPEGEGTRYAQLEGLPWRRTPRLVRPMFRQIVKVDVAAIARLATLGEIG